MFDDGVWGLVRLLGTVAPDVNTNRAMCGRVWLHPSVSLRTACSGGARVDVRLPEPLAKSFRTRRGSTLWHARHMNNNRFSRFLGAVFVVGLLAGCAASPSQTGDAGSGDARLATRAGASAPLGYGEAAAPGPGSKLADAKPLDEDIPDVSRFKQTGRASWYGKHFNGRRTASGERFNMHAMTAAHKTLPLASYVRVTNTSNQKSVVVKINDRGPYVRGRVIDLSYAAARELGLQASGTGHVKIQGLTHEEVQANRAQGAVSGNRAEVVASVNPQTEPLPSHP